MIPGEMIEAIEEEYQRLLATPVPIRKLPDRCNEQLELIGQCFALIKAQSDLINRLEARSRC